MAQKAYLLLYKCVENTTILSNNKILQINH